MHSKYTPKVRNLLHQRFSKLVAIGFAGRYRKTRQAQWLWRCDCGKYKIIFGGSVTQGKTTSCGCHFTEVMSQHGQAKKSQKGPVWTTWVQMIARCHGPKPLKRYGGRGITVCDRWRFGENGIHPLLCFMADMGPKPTPKHTLDRYPDNDGNYEPGNCRWATSEEQSRNRIGVRMITFRGQTMCATDWGKHLGISKSTMMRRLDLWPVERALTEPLNINYQRP